MVNKIKEEIKDLKVVQSNELIRASYKLSKRALLFLLYLIAKIDPINQDVFIDIEMTFQQIKAVLNFD